MKPVNIGPFPMGVNNRREDHDLTVRMERSKIDLLRQAINVDIDASGKLSRRQGVTKNLDAGVPHSLWSDGVQGFYVDGTELHHLSDDGSPALVDTVIRNDLVPGREASFCHGGGRHYYTNGDHIGMVENGQRLDFTARPLLTPGLTAIDGALPKGRYQVCITNVGPGGESGTTVPQVISLPNGGGFRIAPIATPPAGVETRIYMTAADGEVFSRVNVTIDSGAADVVVLPAMRARCQTLLLDGMPPGSIVRFSNARLLVAVENFLFYSEPFFPGLLNMGRNYIAFPKPVAMVEPCAEGVYVAADKTYWLPGNISKTAMATVLPYGAVPGTGGTDPDEPNSCFWVSERGLIRANGAGEVRNVQEANLVLRGGAAGATLMREQNGQKHIVTSVREQMTTRSASGGFFDAEIIRKGVVLP